MTMSVVTTTCDDSNSTQNFDVCREVAEKFVEDIIIKATQEVAQNSTKKTALERQTTLHTAPEIKLDLVGQRSPTPEEETFPWVTAAYADNQSPSQDIVQDVTVKESTSALVEDSNEKAGEISIIELNEFALLYVKDILAKATVLAAERVAARPTLKDDPTNDQGWGEAKAVKHVTTVTDVSNADAIVVEQPAPSVSFQAQPEAKPASTSSRSGSPWYLRLRGVVGRLMRSSCLCKGENEHGNDGGKQTFV